MTIAGTAIPEGEIVLLALGSANRDPAAYERPDELELLPPLTLSGEPGALVWHHGVLLRGLTRLPVRLAG